MPIAVQENLLLVEGVDDKHVFSHLLTQHNWLFESTQRDSVQLSTTGLDVHLSIKEANSLDLLLSSFPSILKTGGLQRIGIVVDADEDIAARWQSLRCMLTTEAGYPPAAIPFTPDPDGTLIVSVTDLPRLGIWVIPDNNLSGILEDFTSTLIPEDDLLWPKAQAIVQQLLDEQPPLLPQTLLTNPSYPSKAKIHTWLAWQKEPGTPLGSAINKTYLKANAPLAQQFVAWVRLLFEV